MSRRVVVVGCLALGLALAPGVALADPPWQVPDGWGDQARGDVCKHRGEPPCHTTTTNPTTTSTGGWSTSVTPTTTAVSGTSATSTTTTTTEVAGTTTASTTTTTSVAGTTAPATTTTALGATATVPPRVVSASAGRALASTGAAPLWTGLGGLAALLTGGVLLLFSRRRRA